MLDPEHQHLFASLLPEYNLQILSLGFVFKIKSKLDRRDVETWLAKDHRA